MSGGCRHKAVEHLEPCALAIMIAHGDTAAFSELYRRHSGALYLLAYFYLKDEEEASDALQQVFMTLWENRRKLDGDRNPAGYLVTTMKNYVLNRLRSRRVHLRFTSDTLSETGMYTLSPHELMERKETERLLELAVSDLRGDARREIVRLRREGLSNKEVAERLNLPENTVKTYYAQSVKALREHFKRYL